MWNVAARMTGALLAMLLGGGRQFITHPGKECTYDGARPGDVNRD